MEFRIWVEARLAGRVLERQLVAQVEREASGIGPEEIGLTLEEGKTVLRQVQARMIQTQVEAVEAAHRNCVQCGRKMWNGKWRAALDRMGKIYRRECAVDCRK